MAEDPSTSQRAPVQIGRTLPHSIEAEEYLLSCCLLDGSDVISRCLEARIRRESFYVDAHGVIFERLIDLYNRSVPIDVGVLAEDLKTAKLLDGVGGYAFLTQVSGRIPTTAQAGYYIEKVRELSLLREIIRSATSAVESCYDFSGGIDEFVDQVETRIFSVTQNRVSESAKPMREPTREAMNVITKMMMKKGELTGVSSGFIDLDKLTWGFQKQEMIILAARPSMGKCLSHDSEIVLADGSIATMADLNARKQADLLTLSEDLTFNRSRPSAYVDDGLKPVFRVTSALGRRVEATLPHPFLTPDGWTKLENLSLGTKIAVARELPVFGNRPLPAAEIKVAGYKVGENTLPHGDAPMGILDFVAGQELTEAMAEVEGSGQGHRLLGSALRVIPAQIFTLPRAELAMFVSRVFAVNGWIRATEDNSSELVLIVEEERLARQISHLLLRFGIVSALRRSEAGSSVRQLVISDGESLIRFGREIGIFGKEDAIDSLLSQLDEHASRVARLNTQGDVVWDEIVSIEPVGVKQVYDLTIPETHNFVANDVCVHNTSLCLGFAEAAAMPKPGKGEPVGVLVFSLEMSASQLALRMLCSRSRVNMKLLRDGLLSKNGDEQNRLLECADEFSKAPLFIDDSSSLSIMQLRAKARRLHARNKLGLIIVDYLQLMAPTDGKMPREQQVAEASRGLKALAKELDLPVLVLSQLNRASEKENRTPKLADLRESGSIEQDADIVLMLARPKDADEKFQVAADSAELIVAKQRNGPVGELKLTFLRDITRFENYTQ